MGTTKFSANCSICSVLVVAEVDNAEDGKAALGKAMDEHIEDNHGEET